MKCSRCNKEAVKGGGRYVDPIRKYVNTKVNMIYTFRLYLCINHWKRLKKGDFIFKKK